MSDLTDEQVRLWISEALGAQRGMMRFQAACAAMQGLLSSSGYDCSFEVLAADSVRLGDQLLAELSRAEGEKP